MDGRVSAQWKRGGADVQGYLPLHISGHDVEQVELRVAPPVPLSGTVELDGKPIEPGMGYAVLEAVDGMGRVEGELEFERVRFAYGQREVLHEIQLTIPPGGCYAIVGESGGGKSTLAKLAARLYETGALWNSFIFGSAANWLLGLLRTHLGETVEDMATAFARHLQHGDSSLTQLYENLSPADFSRSVVQQVPQALRVITAPACGWNDLGTPRRVANTLRRLAQVSPRVRSRPVAAGGAATSGLISLATRHARAALTG